MADTYVIGDSVELDQARSEIIRAFEKASFQANGDCFIDRPTVYDIKVENGDPEPVVTFGHWHVLTSEQISALSAYTSALLSTSAFDADA